MDGRRHTFETEVEWTGNVGAGTASYAGYGRDHAIRAPGKPEIPGSSAPAFRGDARRYNPEELLVAALAACHMLWYLHLATTHGLRVVGYRDRASGTMVESADGGGRFVAAVLRPRVELAAGDAERARALHEEAHAKCFIARSVNFPVTVEPTTIVGTGVTATGRGSA